MLLSNLFSRYGNLDRKVRRVEVTRPGIRALRLPGGGGEDFHRGIDVANEDAPALAVEQNGVGLDKPPSA